MRIHPAFVILFSLASFASAQTKRPMTFEDMMQMRRLGDTDVSPDGKWLLYSVTDVDLAANTRIPKLWLQLVAGGEPKLLSGTEAGDSNARFSHDGQRILFLSSRGNQSQQLWLEDFDPTAGTATNPRSAIPHPNPKTNVRSASGSDQGNVGSPNLQLPDADNPIWSPDSIFIVFTAQVYPDCPAIVPDSFAGERCNAGRDAAQAASKVKARIFDHLLYRHWNAFTGDKRSHLFELEPSPLGDNPRPDSQRSARCPALFALGGGGGFAISPDSKELAFTENLDEEPAISTNADIFTLDLTNPAAKPVKVSTSALAETFQPQLTRPTAST